MVKYGYARVSTKGQERNGNSLEDQINKLKAEGCTEIFTETYTGAKKDRPQFQKLLSVLQESDTLTISKLDRFARSTEDAIHTIKMLFDRGIKVHVLNMGLIENTPTGRLIFNILSSFSEFERDMIIERTQEGKALAKATNKDYREGRPKVHKRKAIEHALELLKIHSYPEVVDMTGISKSTLVRAKRKANANEMENQMKSNTLNKMK